MHVQCSQPERLVIYIRHPPPHYAGANATNARHRLHNAVDAHRGSPHSSGVSRARDSYRVAGSFGVAADNFNLVGNKGVTVIELEIDILDEKGPHVVAESVCVEMALRSIRVFQSCLHYLECQSSLDLVGQDVCDGFVEGCNHSHCRLGL